MKIGKSTAAWAFVLVVAVSRPALAGPPYITDDPEPTETGHFENYLYVEGTRAGGVTGGPAEGIELNYGAFEDTQLSLSVPLDFNPGQGSVGTLFAPLGAGVKYRFIEEDEDGWRPQVAVFPQIFIPVGSESHSVPTTEFLPIWAQKSFGPWVVFGGGGLNFNPGTGNRDYFGYGFAVARQVTEHVQLGAEIFGDTRASVGVGSTTAVGLGAIYDLSEHWHLIGSVNTGIDNARQGDAYSYIFAIKWTI